MVALSSLLTCRFLRRNGEAGELDLVTEGTRSPGQDLVKFAISAGLMVIFVVAASQVSPAYWMQPWSPESLGLQLAPVSMASVPGRPW
jgi:hypothetical protein